MTDMTPPQTPQEASPTLATVLTRLDLLIAGLEQMPRSGPSEMQQVATHLQTIADQTKRTATLLAETSHLPWNLAARLDRIEAQNANLQAQLELLITWLGDPPQVAAAPT
jgi:hypothetical protein